VRAQLVSLLEIYLGVSRTPLSALLHCPLVKLRSAQSRTLQPRDYCSVTSADFRVTRGAAACALGAADMR